jgi:hypothetical protein
MLSVQEVNFYNDLYDRGLVDKINCPFDDVGVLDHIILTKVKDDDKVYFKCLTCTTSFEPGVNTIEKIKNTIDKYINQG